MINIHNEYLKNLRLKNNLILKKFYNSFKLKLIFIFSNNFSY
jgi:hypothetical protein